MSKNVLIVGQAPGRLDDPAAPLTGASGRFLAKVMGMTGDAYIAETERVNLLPYWPGKLGGRYPGIPRRPDRFPIAEARRRAAEIMPRFNDFMTVILLGRNVERAFFPVWRLPWFVMTLTPEADILTPIVVMPHPSGRNRWWNSVENRRLAERFFNFMWEDIALSVGGLTT